MGENTPKEAPADVIAAAETYLARQDRAEHPDGYFDKAGRWYPSDTEIQGCCGRISGPTRNYPYPYMLHCRTAVHIAQLYGVAVGDLKRQVNRMRPTPREGGESYYKAVAVVNGRYFSIFDGTTEYRLGETTTDRARQGHMGGIYCYDNEADARRAAVPSSSALLHAPRAILRVRAEGAYCRYPGDKLAFSHVTPLEVVCDTAKLNNNPGTIATL